MQDDLNCNFGYEILTELPNNLPVYYIPNEGGGVGRDGVIVRFYPTQRLPWIGIFAFGDMLPNGKCEVYPGPGRNHLSIVARGEAYIVSPDDPESFERVLCCPNICTIPIPSRGLVLFHDYTEVIAHNESGLAWRTDRISWDGIEIDKVTPNEVVGKSWDAPNEKKIEFRINLANGKFEGGALPPNLPSE